MLADASDVAAALGLDSDDELKAAQLVRVEGLLERVSDAFQRLTGRLFTTGTTNVRAHVVDGRAILPGIVKSVNSVATVDGIDVAFEHDGNAVTVARNGCKLHTGDVVVVNYEGGGIPKPVTAFVAAVAARHLTVEPGSEDAKSVSVTAGPFSRRNADWVSATGLFTPDELASLDTYRRQAPSVVIHRL